ncbi:hypothetical protein BV25DRAFT_1915457 [Artomyces pyxidatus]|uniref:Uncharacterized protein n=1 Tax=Artomyces pyxidatus TaxID=48021 RepID=A0ACB8T4S4_9AGAM|nr:hypothetical protein BV25DRAFT_1915457 [Artomyces pyxidatus]
MPALPWDVYVEILEWVYRASQAKEIDYPTLCAASLVCRSWRPLAQRLLFRRVRRRLGEEYLFTNILQQNRSLGQHVRSLNVGYSVDFADLLECCPNTTELVLELPLSKAEIESAAPRLHALNLQIAVLDLHAAWDIDALLELWPSTSCLLYDYGHIYWSSRTPLWGPLISLKIPAAVFAQSYLDELVPPGVDTLREIEIDGFIPDRVPEWFARAGPHLKSFTARFPAFPSLRRHFGSLEQVVFSALVCFGYTFPESVRHVGYHCDGTELSTYCDHRGLPQLLVAIKALPHLQLVTATRASRKDVLAAIETVCRQRGVEFIIYPDAESFPRPRNVDWL